MSGYSESRRRSYPPDPLMVPRFKVGDIVRLKTGKSPQKVMEIRYDQKRNMVELICLYLTSEAYHQRGPTPDRTTFRSPRDQEDYVPYDGGGNKYLPSKWLAGIEEKEAEMAQDLYMVKEPIVESMDGLATNRFGTKLTVNSQGKYVLEMKGEGGKVEAFDHDELELVVPYTVQFTGIGQGVSGFHLQCEEGKFEKDDVLIESGSGIIYRVSEVDTKNRHPKSGKMTFIKLQSEKITVGHDS